MRIAKLLTLLCALPLAACGVFSPMGVSSIRPDGRMILEIRSSYGPRVCVDRIRMFEINEGQRGREIWSVREDPPSAICRYVFVVGETPEGFAASDGVGGTLVDGRDYALVVNAGLVNGELRIAYTAPESAVQ